jgi:hypothetical protein
LQALTGYSCTKLWAKTSYCVDDGISGNDEPLKSTAQSSPMIKPSPSPSTPPTTTKPGGVAPGPTQSGITPKCNKWALQKPNVFCYDMATAAGIALEQLYKWNPALKSDCSGMWPGYAYCVGISA